MKKTQLFLDLGKRPFSAAVAGNRNLQSPVASAAAPQASRPLANKREGFPSHFWGIFAAVFQTVLLGLILTVKEPEKGFPSFL